MDQSEFVYACLYPLSIVWDCFFSDDFYERSTSSYTLLLVPPIFYLITTLLATILAYFLNFNERILPFPQQSISVFFGCILLWIYSFPQFINNCILIAKGGAPIVLIDLPHANRNRYRIDTKFVWLGIVWNLSWFIISLVITGSLWLSPKLSNETSAGSMLWEYGKAQNQFREKKYAEIHGNTQNSIGFCDNFRNLFYGIDSKGQLLKLIPENLADAFAGQPLNAPTFGKSDEKMNGIEYRGYLFLDDPYLRNNKQWEVKFGLFAYPARPKKSGDKILWIGSEREIYFIHSTEGSMRLLTPEESPLHPNCKVQWQVW